MIKSQKILPLLVAVSMVVSQPATLMAQSESPFWTGDLEAQLLLDEDCRVVEYEVMHEGELGGRAVFNATVVCEDGRRFDAHLIEPEVDFTIKICEIVRC